MTGNAITRRLFENFAQTRGQWGERAGDGQGAEDLGERHPAELLLAIGMQKATGGGQQLLGECPFLFAALVEPAVPIGGIFHRIDLSTSVVFLSVTTTLAAKG